MTVAEISKISQLHRQDIYKIIPILEKKGLITRTIDKPALIESIPVEKALNSLLATEKEKNCSKISHLELNLKEITNEVSNHSHKEMNHEEELFIPLTNDEQVRNRANISFEKAKKTYDMHVNMDLLLGVIKVLTLRFLLLNKKLRVRMILENSNRKEALKIIQPLISKNIQFEVKITKPSKSISYYVFDNIELWISLKKTTETGLPQVLWTNDKNIVKFFQESFNVEWNNPKLKTIHPPKEKTVSAPQFA